MSGAEGMDLCVRCKQRLGFFREDVQNQCLCAACWEDLAGLQAQIASLTTYGDEQYAEGVDNGWTQALNALADYAARHPHATAREAAIDLERDGREKKP